MTASSRKAGIDHSTTSGSRGMSARQRHPAGVRQTLLPISTGAYASRFRRRSAVRCTAGMIHCRHRAVSSMTMLDNRTEPPPPPPWPAGYPEGYAVVDVETTGLGRDDRIVSAAVYQLDAHGAVQDHWYSPVNPQRDPGPVWIHGLTGEMLADAPLFPEIAGQLAARLSGRVLVAHNAVFDWSMLAREY